MKKPAPKKPAAKKAKPGGYVVMSFTVPPELEDAMNAAAAARGFNRSAYIVWLVQRDLRDNPGLPEPPRMPRVPSRVKRRVE
jgi:hypothetical protein